MPKQETNHLWISGSSRTVEEIAREAFRAGMQYSYDKGAHPSDNMSYFQQWLNETRQNMNEESLRQRDVQGSG